MSGIKYLTLIYALFFTVLNAQDSTKTDPDRGDILLNDLQQFYSVTKGIITSPLYFEENEWLQAFYICGSTALTTLVDKNVKTFSQKNTSPALDRIFKIDSWYNGKTVNIGFVSLYLAGLISKNQKIRIMGLNAFEAHLFAQTITGFLKFTTGRKRPYAADSNYDFKIFRGKKEKYRAFPSGHTTSAFAFSSVMALSYDNIYWQTIWYGSATMVAAARIYHNVHWISDTIFSASVSYFVARYVTHFNREEKPDSISLNIIPGRSGLILSIHF